MTHPFFYEEKKRSGNHDGRKRETTGSRQAKREREKTKKKLRERDSEGSSSPSRRQQRDAQNPKWGKREGLTSE